MTTIWSRLGVGERGVWRQHVKEPIQNDGNIWTTKRNSGDSTIKNGDLPHPRESLMEPPFLRYFDHGTYGSCVKFSGKNSIETSMVGGFDLIPSQASLLAAAWDMAFTRVCSEMRYLDASGRSASFKPHVPQFKCHSFGVYPCAYHNFEN